MARTRSLERYLDISYYAFHFFNFSDCVMLLLDHIKMCEVNLQSSKSTPKGDILLNRIKNYIERLIWTPTRFFRILWNRNITHAATGYTKKWTRLGWATLDDEEFCCYVEEMTFSHPLFLRSNLEWLNIFLTLSLNIVTQTSICVLHIWWRTACFLLLL